MDFPTVVGLGSNVETLKCFVCKSYLSYFPISLCLNSQSICGRCAVPEGVTAVPDPAFEAVVEHLKFPCRYRSEGCFDELHPKGVPEHEKSCSFRIVKCVVDEPKCCDWSGSLPTLIDHCEKEHSEIFLKRGEFEMDLEGPVERQHLMGVDDKLFIFQKKFDLDSKMVICAVYPNGYEADAETYSCQLIIRKGDTTIAHKFDTTSVGEKIFQEICLQFAKKETGHHEDSVTIKLSIKKKGIDNESENESTISKLRNHLKCSICGTFAGPSVFRDSESMEMLCSEPQCSKKYRVEDTLLTSVVTLLKYPCRFQKNGCTYTSILEEVKAHQDVCPYKRATCLLRECLWEGLRRDTEHHLLEQHAHRIFEMKKEIQIPISNPRTILAIVRYRDRLFRLDYCVEKDGRLLCSVLKIGFCKQKFNFEVEVAVGSELTVLRRHVMTRRCGQLTEDTDDLPADCCEFLREQVFGKAANTTFTLRIFKAP